MRLYKLVYYTDQTGTNYVWASSYNNAKTERAIITRELKRSDARDVLVSAVITSVDIPTTRADLVRWLNQNLVTDRRTEIRQ